MSSRRMPFFQKLEITAGGILMFARVILSIVTSIPGGSSEPPSYKLRLVSSVMKAYARSFTSSQIQAMGPGTGDTYKSFMQNKGRPVATLYMADGTEGHWIGPRDAPVVFLFFHGGGYATPLTNGHMALLETLVSRLEEANKSIGVLILQYDLAPEAAYPYQMRQAVQAYKHLVEELSYAPENILLGGDSAGGHLALGLLSCLLHPRSDMPTIKQPIRPPATILVSPWVTFDLSSDSMTRNKHKDILDLRTLKTWSAAYTGSSPLDNYNSPLDAPTRWWEKLQDTSICILSGEDEVFVDDIAQFADRLKAAGVRLDYKLMKDEAHDALIWYESIGMSTPASKLAVIDWVLSQAGPQA